VRGEEEGQDGGHVYRLDRAAAFVVGLLRSADLDCGPDSSTQAVASPHRPRLVVFTQAASSSIL